MIDLETRLRETMEAHTPSPVSRPMPANTASRVVRRRAASIATTMAVGAAFVLGAGGLFRYLSSGPTAQRPAGEATVAMPSPTGPGVTYVTPAPFADLGPGEWPTVEVGGVKDPYVDREVGADLNKSVVASGFVEGTEWSLTTFAARGSGTCGELFVGEMGDDGGARFCSQVPDEPGQSALRIAGTSFGLGPVTAYAGVVTPAVARVEFELVDGSHRTVEFAPRLDAGVFVLFVPIDAAGRIVAFDQSGERLASEPMCVGTPAPVEQVTGCGNGLSTTFSAVSAQP